MPTPVSQQERALILDALRGFAVLGIFIDNIFGFTGWAILPGEQKAALSTWPVDQWMNRIEQAFVHGKFYSIFSLLFGIGFSILLMRNDQLGVNSLRIFYRRLFILFLIGMVHLCLLWDGDILVLYAILGALLPLFRNASNRTLIISAVALLASPLLLDAIFVLFDLRPGQWFRDIAIGIDISTGLPIDNSFVSYLYEEGSGWQEWRNWTMSGPFYRYAYLLDSNRLPKVMGMFLLGFYAGRNLLYVHLEQHRVLFGRLRLWGLVLGLPATAAMVWFSEDGFDIPAAAGLWDTLCYTLSVVPLCLAYVSMFCLSWMHSRARSFLAWFAPVGRMALSHYLLQTLIGIGLFYGVGLGWGGQIGPALFVPLALLIFGIQVALSHLWFRYFGFGPVEWVWRQLTYGKRLPLRRKHQAGRA